MVTIKRNANANNNLRRAVANGSVNNLFRGRGFYNPMNTIGWEAFGRYAMLGNNSSFIGFALVQNNANKRVIELIGARKGYGRPLMNRIVKNAKNNGKSNLLLAAANESPGSVKKLLKFYSNMGFKVSGPLQLGFTPMTLKLRKGGLGSMRNNNKN